MSNEAKLSVSNEVKLSNEQIDFLLNLLSRATVPGRKESLQEVLQLISILERMKEEAE